MAKNLIRCFSLLLLFFVILVIFITVSSHKFSMPIDQFSVFIYSSVLFRSLVLCSLPLRCGFWVLWHVLLRGFERFSAPVFLLVSDIFLDHDFIISSKLQLHGEIMGIVGDAARLTRYSTLKKQRWKPRPPIFNFGSPEHDYRYLYLMFS